MSDTFRKFGQHQAMKDLFSTNAALYAQFRPHYPDELFRFIYAQLENHESAWDVGTGNGQIAAKLARHFTTVLATDISDKQLAEASRLPNIQYRKQAAEAVFSEQENFDLIISAQAIHWFDFPSFYARVYEHLKPKGLLAATGYGLIGCKDEQFNGAIRHLYYDLLGNCWDPERKYIDDAYKTIPFPFREISCPHFAIAEQWTANRLCAYLETWSAVNHYKERYEKDPLASIRQMASAVDPEVLYDFEFPVFVRAGFAIR
ncbi:class I SAM-dependent methyltransferase [Rurimicrobium arvi]|uniref:Class I SAM-dependent methyltransferase n=2 Tax=Rurimicrobium arvi TaxID=2049916 RepID=A0ABP8MI46_9BACT